ncbi:MAG: hypothetical protein JWR85_2823 [Marmoricola sp.]|nr:hypothetical protein [Marmoricola sp.]
MDSPEESSPASAEQARHPWFRRALPVTAVALVVVALAALLSPGIRHQLDLSLRRQPSSYVELYFPKATPSGSPATCTRKGGTVRVAFVVESHLGSRRSVAYRVTLDPTTKGLRTKRKPGSAVVSPGKSVLVQKSFALPRREGYVVSVVLPDLDERLRARCQAPRS